MAGTYKITEVVGTSPVGFAEAVKSAVKDASKTVRHMDWFEVVEERGRIADGKGRGIPGHAEDRVQDRKIAILQDADLHGSSRMERRDKS